MTELQDTANICVQNSGVEERNKAVSTTSLHCPGSEQIERKINHNYGEQMITFINQWIDWRTLTWDSEVGLPISDA